MMNQKNKMELYLQKFVNYQMSIPEKVSIKEKKDLVI